MAALDLDSKTSLETECVPSHIVNLRGSLKPISSVKWKRDSWMSHLYGTILKPSHTDGFTDWWTSSLRDTHASRSAQQENEQEKKTQDTSGLGSQTEFDFFSQECVFSRTSKDTSLSDSERSLENWNQWVTRCRGAYSVRVKSAHLTNANECSSWPTPQTGEEKVCMTGTQNQRMLSHAVVGLVAPAKPSTDGSRQESWRTPSSSDGEGGVMEMREGCAGKYKLRDHVVAEQKAWATPIMGDSHLASTPEVAQKRIEEGKVTLSRQNPGKLNPRWVEPLMGLPVGWVMPSCKMPIVPCGKIMLGQSMEQWPTPSADGDSRPGANADVEKWTQIRDKKKAQGINKQLFLTTKVMMEEERIQTFASPVTIELTNCDCSATESCLQQPSEHSESFGRNSND